MSIKWIKIRILCVSSCFVLFMCLLLLRSYHLQILSQGKITDLVEHQYMTTVPSEPKRGTITDRNGKELAMDVLVSSIALHPKLIKKSDEVVKQLSGLLNIDAEKIQSKLKSTKKFEWLARRIDRSIGDKIKALKLEGVVIIPEYKRFYPNKEVAANILGAVGYEANALGGLELSYDSYLKASAKSQVVEKDAKGRAITPINIENAYHDVRLTLDLNIQFIAEKYLTENAKKFNAKSGFAIVMDPKTGEILAMANYPSFDPNKYSQYPQEYWKNHAILDSFEPGSTFKAVVVAAALNSGKVKPNDYFDCENGSYKIGKQTIHDHGSYGKINVKDIVKYSSNIGVTKIAQKIGKEAFYQTIISLGFGSKLDLGLPSEEKGILRSAKNWAAIDQSNIAFGQGLTVTGVQMAQAYSTFANNGVKMKAYLVKEVRNADGSLMIDNKPQNLGAVVSPEAAHELNKMLQTVVEEGGTGTLASMSGYSVAGKTGTAQKVDPVTHKYAPGVFVSSFIGFVPADNPELVIYVAYDTPRPVYFGGTVAAPVFNNIAKEALAYRGIAPEKTVELAQENKKVEENGASVTEVNVANENVVNDIDAALQNKTVPNLKGMSMREVLQFFQANGIKGNIKGSGVVAGQSPKAGEPLKEKTIFEVELRPPT